VRCQQTDGQGRWSDATPLLPGTDARQYLPAATFQGETLWVAAYTSDATVTRVVLAPFGERGADALVTLAEWPVPSDGICAPHPPPCSHDQTFIGDYIGAVATPNQVVVAAVRPGLGDQDNGIVVLRHRNGG
jgi:hypothetical protein